ncbi:MAG: PQQ-binding-like beta-propeller repeat protein [Candidatus Bathyarchaeia archaeon]
MKTLNINKMLSIAIMLILSLSAVLAVFSNDVAKANITPYQGEVFPTWTYISINPSVEGVGQTMTLVFWCDLNPPTAIGQFGDRWTFTVNVVKPDGTNDTLGPFTSDPVGICTAFYTPTVAGQYEFQAFFEQHVIDGGASRGLISPGGIGYWPSGSPYITGFNPATGQFTYLNPVGDVMLPSASDPVNATVQSTAIPPFQETPLPNDYWSRPVYDANRNWGQIMGEWYNANELNQFGAGGRYNPYSLGPATAHILWTSPYWFGGIAGGVAGLSSVGYGDSAYSGQSYQAYGSQPYMVLNGIAYVSIQTDPIEGFYELNLATGQRVYYANTTGPVVGAGGPFASVGSIPAGLPAFGQVLDMETPNQHGQLSYYWVTSTANPGQWDCYDSYSNQYICSIGNIPSWVSGALGFFAPATATKSYGNDGSILEWQIANLAPVNAFGVQTGPNQLYLQCWNTTQAILAPSDISDLGYLPIYGQPSTTIGTPSGSNTYWMWRPELNNTYDGSLGYSVNITIPSNIAYQSSGLFGPSPTMQTQIIPDKEIIGIYPGSNNGSLVVPGQAWAIGIADSDMGHVLWQYNFTAPAGVGDAAAQSQLFSQHDTAYAGAGGIFGGMGMDVNASIFWYQNTLLRQYYVYSLTTGDLLWTSPPEAQWEFYGASAVVYNNMFIDTGGWGGVVTAYNAQTGAFLWNWTAPSVGQGETPYQYTPIDYGCLSSGGQIYFYSGEHSVNNPIRRDAAIWDVNATNGQEIWQSMCWPSGSPILADGDLLVLDDHDNQIYNYGKGPSSTTVEATTAGVVQGTSFPIQGSVWDVSPGTTQSSIALRFPQGVPAVSDASQQQFMAYVYQQQGTIATNTTGVPVDITLIDPNGNIINEPTVTSDASGHYSLDYKAGVPGLYTVIANFVGTNAYYPSYSETSFVVNSAPSPTNAPTATPTSVADMYFVPAIAGLFVLIIIVLIVVVLLMLRKRP